MNKAQTKIITEHLIDNIPELTKPLLKRLEIDYHTNVNDAVIYSALNLHILTEAIKFLAERL